MNRFALSRSQHYTSVIERSLGLLRMTPAVFTLPVLLLLAVLLRFFLIYQNWPVPNGDEAVMGLMAKHIAYGGEHPIFYYGQNYMGTIQAYLGAALIYVFGISIFTIRLGTLLLFALYFVCFYLLVRRLYTRNFALISAAICSLGSGRSIGIPLSANGGYAETMVFAALTFWLASHLALTSAPAANQPKRWRLLLYVGLGGAMGLALWSDQLVLPGIATAGLLLLLYCRRDVRFWWAALLAGIVIGGLPLLIYNLTAAPGQDSLHALAGLTGYAAKAKGTFLQPVLQTLVVALPGATGGEIPGCLISLPDQAVQNLVDIFPSPTSWPCVVLQGGWSLGMIVLWCMAVLGVITALWRSWRRGHDSAIQMSERRDQVILQSCRLLLLISGAFWLLLFALSQAAIYTPRPSARYLICLLLVTPAILWPLWKRCSDFLARPTPTTRLVRLSILLNGLVLALVMAVALLGTIDIIGNVSAAQKTNQQRKALVDELLRLGVTRAYSEYWTCNVLIFESNERIICSDLDASLQPDLDRYPPYHTLIQKTAHPAYIFPLDSAQAQTFAQEQGAVRRQYQRIVWSGYVVYIPD